jgi:(p)ppGpp synthase/HD superfamily hydrolase
MFTKQDIIEQRRTEAFNALARGEQPPKAGLTLAALIMTCAHYTQKQWSGEDYAEHPLLVGLRNTRSTAKQIIGILHDVVEDGGWTLDDLRTVGFDKRIVDGVDGVTRREGEKYFDFIERCSLNADSLDVKINDIEHNSTWSRNHALMALSRVEKQNVYIISYNYLVAVKKGDIAAGTPMRDFVAARPALDPGAFVMEDNSSHPYGKDAGAPKPDDYTPW